MIIQQMILCMGTAALNGLVIMVPNASVRG
jgi:hypothetical protein